MKNKLHPFARNIAVLMSFILLIQQFSCVNSKIITTADLPSYYPKYAYEIHCQESVYLLEKIVITNDTLTGRVLNPEWEVLQTSNFIHIYPSSDSLVKINSAKILSLPLSGIIKAESKEKAHGKSTLLVLSGITVVLLILLGFAMASGSSTIDLQIK